MCSTLLIYSHYFLISSNYYFAFFFSSLRELKDNLGSDEPEGDAPVLLQTMLARNPGIFREKSMEMIVCCTV